MSPNYHVWQQVPLNDVMIILVFYEISKSNLILALGTYKANSNNNVTGNSIFHVSKKTPGDGTINKK